jgi:hypothetical protein
LDSFRRLHLFFPQSAEAIFFGEHYFVTDPVPGVVGDCVWRDCCARLWRVCGVWLLSGRVVIASGVIGLHVRIEQQLSFSACFDDFSRSLSYNPENTDAVSDVNARAKVH